MAGGKKGGKRGGGGGGDGEKKPAQNEQGQQFKFNFGASGEQKTEGVKLDLGVGGKGDKAMTFDFGGKDAALLPAIQKKLGTLVGKSSGYFESLPPQVQDRIRALKSLHRKKTEMDKEFKKELRALEQKFDKLINPLYDRRSEIIIGKAEPTAEEIVEEKKEEEKKEEKKEEEKKDEKKEEKKDEKKEDVKGIPDFWLEALKHHDDFGEMITKRDEPALKHLIDVRWKAAEGRDDSSFVLEFEFSENPYFTNKVIAKTYILNDNEVLGETMFDHVEATEIEWKTGKNLTVKMVAQQTGGRGKYRGGRRGGKGGPAKTVMVEEPCESFFNFFSPDMGMDEEMEDYDMQDILEADYEMGLQVKDQIIPNAILWFTGEIQDLFGGMEFEGGEEDDDGEEGEYDSAEDPDFEPDPNAPQQKPECNQQ